jgi:HAMP domain-containing protein
LLTLHWLTSVAAVLVALVALFRARRVSRRLDRLAESYWELRYEYGQLRARIGRLDGPGPQDEALPEQTHTTAPRENAQIAFVPLSSLKR